MKLKIEKTELLNGMNIISKAISSNDVMPIVQCVLLSASDDGLRLTSNNLELAIQTAEINIEMQESGSVALEASFFSNIIKKLSDDYIQITVGENYATVIKSGKSVFKIEGKNPADFPSIPTVEKENKFSMNRSALKTMIRQTIFAVAKVDARPVLTGALLEIENGIISVVGIDGFRIAYRYNEADATDIFCKIVVPGKSIADIAKLLDGSDGSEANIFFTNEHVLFELDNCTIVSRLIEGDYMKYKKVLASEYTTLVKIHRNELLASLERAILIAIDDSKKVSVKLSISGSTVNISSNTQRGDTHEEIMAEIDGTNLEIEFNPKYLIDALKAIEDDMIAIQYTNKMSPCIIRPIAEGNYKYLILPLRPNS